MRKAIKYFDDNVSEVTKSWHDKAMADRKGITKKISGKD